MSDINNVLKVDGVSDILMEVAKLRAERDLYKEKYESLRDCTLSNTELSWGDDGLRLKNSEELNYMLKFLAPVEHEERLKTLRREKARQEKEEAEAREEANNE